MVKLDWRPTSSAWLRSIRAATEWKVPSHGMPSIAPPESLRDALVHLARGLVGEGDGEDLARPGFAGRDQMGEPRGQCGGLAGAGAGEHEHRAFGRQYGLALRRVQALQIGGIGTSEQAIQALGRGRRRGTKRQPRAGGRRSGKVPSCSRYPRYPQACYRIFRFRNSEAGCMVLR